MQEGVTVEVLLNNSAMGLVISFKFVKKQESKQKKIEKNLLPGHRERMEINIIGEQKWSVILWISWLAHYNLEIN